MLVVPVLPVVPTELPGDPVVPVVEFEVVAAPELGRFAAPELGRFAAPELGRVAAPELPVVLWVVPTPLGFVVEVPGVVFVDWPTVLPGVVPAVAPADPTVPPA